MWRVFLAIATIIMAADGYGLRGIKPKRDTSGYVPLDSFSFSNFFKQFGTTLAHLLGTDYNATKADAESLKADMTSCKSLMTAKQEICKSDAKAACEPGLDDIILHYLNEAASPFVDLGNLIGDSQEWASVENWFGKLGSSFASMGDLQYDGSNLEGFANWDGWGDMKDFFKSLGEGFVSGLEDFFKLDFKINIFRRKRSLMLKERAGGDQLVHFIRALAELYSRGNKDSREISDEARACMEKCDSCKYFLGDTETMINGICGSYDLLARNVTYFTTVTKLQLVYALLTDEAEPILKSVTYDPFSFSQTIMGYTRIELTAKFASGYRGFVPTEGFRMMAQPQSAALIALEYYKEV